MFEPCLLGLRGQDPPYKYMSITSEMLPHICWGIITIVNGSSRTPTSTVAFNNSVHAPKARRDRQTPATKHVRPTNTANQNDRLGLTYLTRKAFPHAHA